MSTELTPWSAPRSLERKANRQLGAIEIQRTVGIAKAARDRDIAVARVLATADVAETVIGETVKLGLLRAQGELVCPSVAGLLDNALIRAGLAMADQIDRPGRA